MHTRWRDDTFACDNLAGRRAGLLCRATASVRLKFLLSLVGILGGCATVRVTDPEYTATQQFLENQASEQAVAKLSFAGLRDQLVFVDSAYLFPPLQHPLEQQLLIEANYEYSFLLGELRARMLREGVRLTNDRTAASVIVEVRSLGVGIDHYEFLLGLAASTLGSFGSTASSLASGGATSGTSTVTPELAIVKSTKQKGYAAVAIVAFRAKTGELLAQSGPFIGRTVREDFWFFGFGPRTVGDIPPAQK